MTHYKEDTHQWLHLHLQSTHNELSLPFNAVALIFLFKNIILSSFIIHKMENPLFTPHLDELFNLWNNAVCHMNYWVHEAAWYRSTSIIERVHAVFFNYYQFDAMTYMQDKIILARWWLP